MRGIASSTSTSNQVLRSTVVKVAFLDAEQVTQIDQALEAIGDFGEVRLIKAKGKLRFIQKLIDEEIGASNKSTS